MVKDIRKFGKIDFALRKCKLDVLFLSLLRKPINTKILDLWVGNLYLKTSRTYQLKLLREDIALKRAQMKSLEKDFNTRKRKLRGSLGIIDYTHVCSLVLNKNEKKLSNKQDIHSMKLFSHLKYHTTLKR